MSQVECSDAKQRRDISIALFIIGAAILIFEIMVFIIAIYTSDPVADAVMLWLYITGMSVVLFVVGIILLIIAVIVHLAATKAIAASCNV